MQAKEANLLQFLDGNKQFVIPIYQRAYSWTSKECKQLWDDIFRIVRNPATYGHFIGSIVHIQHGIYQPSSVPQMLVIDGQQRLTTIFLLLAALRRHIKTTKSNEIDPILIENYLFNLIHKADNRYKLVLTRSDNETLKRILDEDSLPNPPSPLLKNNYDYFYEQVLSTPDQVGKIYEAISKLLIVDVGLDRVRDNPQLIFESLNSTGRDLSQADLIRNFVLMGLDQNEQKVLYENYWSPMEQSFDIVSTDSEKFDRFMRDYLTIKNREIPNIRDVYSKFKSFTRVKLDQGSSISNLVSEISRYSQYYAKVALLKERDIILKKVLTDIDELQVNVAYPFFLELYEDYDKGVLNKNSLFQILQYVESYVFRRWICGVPTNALNKLFPTLARDIDKNNYVESCLAAFLLLDLSSRFPRDEEFKANFPVKAVYPTPRIRYLLRKLENFERKEEISVNNYTIEHIMPQNENLSQQWQQDLGPEWKKLQNQYLHTIGNLTLTGYNSELSDKSFIEKRNMRGGFADSPVRLNSELKKLDHWNEDAIKARAKELTELALKIWPIPYLPERVLTKYRKTSKRRKQKIDASQLSLFDQEDLDE